MAIPVWATADDLRAALSSQTFNEIYIREDLSDVDPTLIALDLQRAHAQVAARTRQPNNGGLPTDDPDGFYKLAVLEYAQAYAYERHPEYRKNKTEFMTRASALCADIRAGKALPKEEAPSPVPSMGSGGNARGSRRGGLPTFVRDDD